MAGNKKVKFTEKELEILDLIAEGKTSAWIGILLRSSPQNIRNRCSHARKKIGLEKDQSLRAWLYANGWPNPLA